jgi:hypothetical protein
MAGVVELFLGLQSAQLFGLFAPFRMGLSAVQVGLLGKGRWKMALTILGSLIFAWALLPKGREALPVLSFHLVGFFLILVFRTRIGRYLSSSSWKKVSASPSPHIVVTLVGTFWETSFSSSSRTFR